MGHSTKYVTSILKSVKVMKEKGDTYQVTDQRKLGDHD